MRGVKEKQTLSLSVQNVGNERLHRIENVVAYSEPRAAGSIVERLYFHASSYGRGVFPDRGEHDVDSTAV